MTKKIGGAAGHHLPASPAYGNPTPNPAANQQQDHGQRSAADRERRARALARRRVHEYRDRPGPKPVGGSPSAGWLDRRAHAARRLPPLDELVPAPRGPGWLPRVDPWAAQHDRSRSCPSCGCCPVAARLGRGGGAA